MIASTMNGPDTRSHGRRRKKAIRGEQVQKQLRQHGIIGKGVSMSGLAEEAGLAHENISEAVESIDHAGIIKTVAELRLIGNIED